MLKSCNRRRRCRQRTRITSTVCSRITWRSEFGAGDRARVGSVAALLELAVIMFVPFGTCLATVLDHQRSCLERIQPSQKEIFLDTDQMNTNKEGTRWRRTKRVVRVGSKLVVVKAVSKAADR